MIDYNYNNWQFWGEYDPINGKLGEQKVTFDGPNRLILVNEGVTELNFRDDVYSAWKEWKQDPTQINAKYPEAVSSVGGDPLPGERLLGSTFFLENNWRMRTWEGNHELIITGNAFTREGDSLFIPTLEAWTITINLNTSTLVETIVPEVAITSGDLSAIANTVWNQQISGSNTALDILLSLPDNVWDEIIDIDKNFTAREKLRKIATKIQDIALD